jgi:hypothetical protein
MKADGSLQCPQEPATGPCHEAEESISHGQILLL